MIFLLIVHFINLQSKTNFINNMSSEVKIYNEVARYRKRTIGNSDDKMKNKRKRRVNKTL